jgi:hypothetical protein
MRGLRTVCCTIPCLFYSHSEVFTYKPVGFEVKPKVLALYVKAGGTCRNGRNGSSGVASIEAARGDGGWSAARIADGRGILAIDLQVDEVVRIEWNFDLFILV